MDHQARVYENIFEMVPNEENPSPMVRINRMNPCSEFVLYGHQDVRLMNGGRIKWLNESDKSMTTEKPVVLE